MQAKGSIFEGKTLDDAVKKGLLALGLERAQVMITVLEEGSGGFLGLGARPFKVRMMPRPAQREYERTARPGRRERGGDLAARGSAPARGGSRRERSSERGPRREGDRQRSSRETDRPGPRREAEPPHGADEERRHGTEPRFESQAAGESGGRRRRGRRGGRGRRPEHAPRIEEANAPSPAPIEIERRRETRRENDQAARAAGDRGPDAPEPAAAMGAAELVALGQRLTSDLLQAMGFEARVTARAENDDVEVTAEVSGDEELLTGRKGEVRQALQHLLNRMINRGGGSRYHLQLEINDFWQRREAQLKELAHTLAEDALASGNERLTEYLNAQERRVVHVALKTDPRVKTYAIGDGLIKKVAVAPAGAEEPEADGPA